HDLPNKQLKERLHFVVQKAVNLVGVNINTASVELLKNVSGLSSSSAQSIVDYREKNGKILNRKEILSIPKIGAKSYEQAAGFLRIIDSKEPLDKTSIHPESYSLTYKIMEELHMSSDDIGKETMKEAINQCDYKALCQKVGCDEYTWKDICDALITPLRDYRDSFDKVLLKSDIVELENLHENDKLQGTVRNVVDFGVFVDIGLHDDGLVHISNMSKNKVSHPSQLVSVGDILDVWVKKIDFEKQKVQLTMIKP
ncbi:MAG: helix-hairpin-helix domain-containing protein, partial [Traorella sp.]